MKGKGEGCGERYRRLCDEVAAVAVRCGREPSEITIVAVTKGYPAGVLRELYAAGCRDVGESRWSEAEAKQEEAAAEALPFSWHLIGTLQSNKVGKVMGRFGLIHSVDSYKLASILSRHSVEKGVTTEMLLQVNISGEVTKHGFSSAEVAEVMGDLLALPHVKVSGLMTMAPVGAPSIAVANYFAALRSLRDALATSHGITLPHLSMGMSADYTVAVAEGSTLLRIGTALMDG